MLNISFKAALNCLRSPESLNYQACNSFKTLDMWPVWSNFEIYEDARATRLFGFQQQYIEEIAVCLADSRLVTVDIQLFSFW